MVLLMKISTTTLEQTNIKLAPKIRATLQAKPKLINLMKVNKKLNNT